MSCAAEVLMVSQFTLYASCAKAKPNYQYSSAWRAGVGCGSQGEGAWLPILHAIG